MQSSSVAAPTWTETVRALRETALKAIAARQPVTELEASVVALQEQVEKVDDAPSTLAWDALKSALADIAAQAKQTRNRRLWRALGRRIEELYEARRRAASTPTTAMQPIRTPRLIRMTFHAAMGIVATLAYTYLLPTRMSAVWVMLAVVGGLGLTEIWRRLPFDWARSFFDQWMRPMAHSMERHRIASSTYYAIGLLIISAATPKLAVCCAILVLGFADPAASLVGFYLARRRFRNGKSMLGTATFIVVGIVSVMAYLTLTSAPLPFSKQLLVAVSATGAGAIAEFYGSLLDDNLMIPLAAAGAAALVL